MFHQAQSIGICRKRAIIGLKFETESPRRALHTESGIFNSSVIPKISQVSGVGDKKSEK